MSSIVKGWAHTLADGVVTVYPRTPSPICTPNLLTPVLLVLDDGSMMVMTTEDWKGKMRRIAILLRETVELRDAADAILGEPTEGGER